MFSIRSSFIWSGAVLSLVLAGCGSSATAAAATNPTATATCPPTTPTAAAVATVSGTLAAVSANSLTVTATTGNVTLATTTATRFSKLTALDPAALTAGTGALFIVTLRQGTATPTAQSVIEQAAGTGGTTGAGGGGRPGGSFNPACRARAGAAARAVRGSLAGIDTQGHMLTIATPQGTTTQVAYDSNTVFATATAAAASDLAIGDPVTVLTRQTASGVTAVSVQDTKSK